MFPNTLPATAVLPLPLHCSLFGMLASQYLQQGSFLLKACIKRTFRKIQENWTDVTLEQHVGVMGKRTFVFRKAADELLHAFFPYGVLEIGCCGRHLFRCHFAIMVPENCVQIGS